MTADEIKAVGKARRPEDLERLAGCLRDEPAPEGRAQAAACLGWQRSERALAPLAAAAQGDADPIVRAAALRALTSLKSADSGQVLERCLCDDDALCRSLALRLAGLLGVRAEAIAGALADTQVPAVVAAESCLAAGRLGDRNNVSALVHRLERSDDDTVRRSAGIAWCQLASLDAPGEEERLRVLLTDPDADLRVAAMGALERLGVRDAASLIAPLRHDPHSAVRRVAIAVHARLTAAAGV